MPQTAIADDLLEEADDIAEFLFGDRNRRRAVYALVQQEDLPVFKMGRKLFARKSALTAWIEAQERASNPH
jgi:hypothetical protein